MKYGVDRLLSGKDMFQFLFFLWQSPTWDNSASMLCSNCDNDIVCKMLSTFATISMPICSVGWYLSDVLFNPKYANHVYRATLVVDNFEQIVWIHDLVPRTSVVIMVWDQVVFRESTGISLL